MKNVLRITIVTLALAFLAASPINQPKFDGGGPIPTCPPDQVCN